MYTGFSTMDAAALQLRWICVLCFIAAISIRFLSFSVCASVDEQVYIVYMGDKAQEQLSTDSYHLNFLEPMLGRRKATESLVHSYRSFNGLAVKLAHEEKQKLEAMDGVVSVFPSRILKPHTTRSWGFLGLNETVERKPVTESDVIIGIIDSGIWPESESFDDEGIAEPPKRWRGTCSEDFKCNNKIIGARYYNSLMKYGESDHRSALDTKGHGSHTAATAAGRAVKKASLHGIANGTAAGAVPSARIAVYKVCWSVGCAEEDILAAFDDAIRDAVDIISVSLGGDYANEYFNDTVAIGSFHALKRGILTSTSAGNGGPSYGSVVNVAPWLLSTAASTMDRRIMSKLALGRKKTTTMIGVAVNSFHTGRRSYPLIKVEDTMLYDVATGNERNSTRGKILLFDDYLDPSLPGQLAAAKVQGMVLVDDNLVGYAQAFPLPATVFNSSKGEKLYKLLRKTRNVMVNIHKSESVVDDRAPAVGSFSARGLSRITPDILKPDLSAPGVEILSAWSPKGPLSEYSDDKRSSRYNIMSGTSMACPHVTGAAAYVKSFHPKWSPSAIMSSLITTAIPMNSTNPTDNELAYGAGQVNPINAVDPGLVYEATIANYKHLLCKQGYNNVQIGLITGDKDTNCTHDEKKDVREFNYPSMSFHQDSPMQPFAVNFTRTVTNVGSRNSTYWATINSGSELNVTVNPTTISFESLEEKCQFVVTVSSTIGLEMFSVASASIVWSDGVRSVRSPIIVVTVY